MKTTQTAGAILSLLRLSALTSSLAAALVACPPANANCSPGEPQLRSIPDGPRSLTTVVRCPRDGVAGQEGGVDLLQNCDFSDGLNFWEVDILGGAAPGRGSVTITPAGRAQLLEGNSFLVTLRQTFVIPAQPGTLDFEIYFDPGFDRTARFIPDAFEVSLLDNAFNSVVPAWDPLATSFFNVQEDLTVNRGAGVTFDGTRVSLDIRAVAPGTVVTLYFDFIGADVDVQGGVQVDGACITLSNRPPVCDAGGPYAVDCTGAVTHIVLDGRGSSDPDGNPLTYRWTTRCPGATITDPHSPVATLNLPTQGCTTTCEVLLSVSDEIAPPESCTALVTVTDSAPPQITCPPDIHVPFGNKICDSAVQDWLNSATATDNCDPDVTITNNAPACGFPCGTTTLVTWTATDDCGNTASCSASITVDPCERATPSQKGSLLVFPKIEVRYDDQGNVVSDTFVSLMNDYPAAVRVQLYFVNGDEYIPGQEPGCNWVDNEITLTQNQPTYWAAATGLPQGVSPWSVLDPSTPPGRPDPDNPGFFVLRGALYAWAVNAADHEIRWNHLSGSATLIDYAGVAAWDYEPWAYQAMCVDHGQEPLDCTQFDANGVCCSATVIPGKLDLDGFQYDFSPDLLLIDYLATGAQLPTADGGTLEIDNDLTFLPVGMDLRQDRPGPIRTKLEFAVWNMNEVRFSGMTRCITCWDQARVSTYGNPNHMLRSFLQTDKGKTRVDGVRSTQCLGSVDAALVGVAARHWTITSGAGNAAFEISGSHMVGLLRQAATIRYDVATPGGQLNPGATPSELTPAELAPGELAPTDLAAPAALTPPTEARPAMPAQPTVVECSTSRP